MSPPPPRWHGAARWLGAVVAVLLLTTWPLARDPTGALLGLPDVEAVEHLWTLWLAVQDGPVVIDTTLASWPYGYRWVLADPLDLLWYLPGHLASPVLGFHLVHLGNLAAAGLTAVLAGRLLLPGPQPPAWATAALAVGATPLAGNLLTGMTEAGTVWVALLAAALLVPAMARGGPYALLAGLVAGLSAWGGPYTALYAALLAPVVVLGRGPAAVREAGVARVAGRLALVGLFAAALAAPVAWAVAMERPEGLPGSSSMTATVLAQPEDPHNRYLGADLLQLLVPAHPRGDGLVHATYLGASVLLLALVGLGTRRAWLLGAAVAWSGLLGLGLYLQLGGEIPRVGGRALLLPAGLLSLAVEALGRAARWHRFLSVTAMLLAPLAAAGALALLRRMPPAARGPALALLVAGCVADQVLASPLPWPRPTLDARLPAIYRALPEPGPLLIVPKQPRRIEGRPRSPAMPLLWQVQHGMPLAERPMFTHTDERLHNLREGLRIAAKLGDTGRADIAREGLRALGYGWIVHHVEPGNTITAPELAAVLGPPDVRTEDGLAWRP